LLLRLRQNRLEGQKSIIEEAAALAFKLGEDLEDPPSFDRVLDDAELAKLKAVTEKLESRYQSRLNEALQMQADMSRWYAQMNIQPVDELGISILNVDLSEEDFIADQTFMDEMNEAHQNVLFYP
ncbi:hypothetical protein AB6A40_009782, partial [Gnathostoma spinigerum]